jgi:hypothetical protein
MEPQEVLAVFWGNVWAGIVANFFFALVTLAGGMFVLSRRRDAMRRFWGASNVLSIRVYLSHLRIAQGGALDPIGASRSFSGAVVTQLEAEAAGILRNLFLARVPGAELQHAWIKSLLFVAADVQTLPSPLDAGEIDSTSTVITLGSPAYNVVSGHAQVESPVQLINDNTAIQLPGGMRLTDTRQSVIVRRQIGGKYWFYAAGLSEAGTAAAARYLATSWRRLNRIYSKSQSFYVAIEMEGTDPEVSRVIAEAPISGDSAG